MFGLHMKAIPSFAFRLHCNNNVTLTKPFLLRTQATAADYLVTSLGVSPESLRITVQLIDLKSTSNADSVVALFLEFGFTKPDIVLILSRRPELLKSDPHKTLRPKLQFLVETGFSGAALTHLLTNDSYLLKQSLNNTIAPCVGFLIDFFGTEHAVLSLFSRRRGSWITRQKTENVPLNLQTLRRYGVSDDDVVKLLLRGPYCLSHDPESFEESVREVMEMGLDPSRKTFFRGLSALASMSKTDRAAKVELFRRFGWTEEQVWALFVKNPMVLTLSVKRLKKSLGFFKERLDWDSQEIIQYPCALIYSLDRRVLPRLAVVDALISKNHIAKGTYKWGYVLSMSEDKFLNKFVNAYQDEVFELYHKLIKKRCPEASCFLI